RHEAEQRTCELTPRMEATPLALDDQTANAFSSLARRESAYRFHLLGGHVSAKPSPAALGEDLALDDRGLEIERPRDPIRRVTGNDGHLLRRYAPQELGSIEADARHFDRHRQRTAAPVVDDAALGLHPQSALTLLFGQLPPVGPVHHHDVPRDRESVVEGKKGV